MPSGVFANQAFTDFNVPENKRAMESALEAVAQQLGREYDLVIGGEHVKTAEKITSINPARPAQVVGIHQKAGAEHAAKAMDAAQSAFMSWAASRMAVWQCAASSSVMTLSAFLPRLSSASK